MFKITFMLLLSVALARVSELNTRQLLQDTGSYHIRRDPALLLLMAALSLFAGLRTEFNDTGNYAMGFRNAVGIAEFLADPENLNPVKNPLFYLCQSLLREFTDEPQWLILLSSIFTQVCLLRFFKRYSPHFAMTVFLYFALGTFNVTLAAMKQTIATAILTLGFPLLEQRKLGRYYLVVLVAGLFHTYAVCFAVLPLFTRRPWSLFTFLFIGGVTYVLMNFRTVIEEFMEQANALGKTLESYEVFDDHTVNLLRVGVYMVTPLFSLCFARWLNFDAGRMDHILIHMSIISMSFMLMGTQAGANMFARMAHYFEIGTLCCLPGMLYKPFEKSSVRLVTVLAVLCFLGFFVYANQSFDSSFQAIGLF